VGEWGVDIGMEAGGDADSFNDDGIADKNSYGVIVICESDSEQEKVYNELTEGGYNCKVVVV